MGFSQRDEFIVVGGVLDPLLNRSDLIRYLFIDLTGEREDYNAVRPHSALQDRTPAAVGAMWVDPRESTAAKEDGIELEIIDASIAFQI